MVINNVEGEDGICMYIHKMLITNMYRCIIWWWGDLKVKLRELEEVNSWTNKDENNNKFE